MEKIIKGVLEKVPQEIDYITNVQEYVRKMEKLMDDLNNKLEDTNLEIKNAETKRMCCTSEARGWLEKVADMQKEVAAIRKDLRGHKTFPTFLSRRANKAYKDVEELIKQRESLRPIVMPAPSETIVEKPVPDIKGEAIGSNVKEIRSLLGDDRVRTVGIWGMGGLGKTTLLNMLNNSMIGEGNNIGFDYVIFVEASKKPEPEKMRNEIAKFLNLPPDSSTDSICSFLKGKSFLLLLDNLWKELDLSIIGIPLAHGQSSSSTLKQKVVLTTRMESMCGDMGANVLIRVKCLEPVDAWALFIANTQPKTINSNSQIKSTAELIVKECGGLPLALVVIGKAMFAKHTVQEWVGAYTSLKNSDVKSVTGEKDPISAALMVSYDNLPDDIIRECFLGCSLWREGSIIRKDEIIEHWMGRGLIDDFDDFNKVLIQGSTIIGQLTQASLLEFVGDDKEAVKIHDMVRDFALWVASGCGKTRKNKWIVETGAVSPQVSTAMALQWTEAKLVSLMDNKIKALPEQLSECPNLSTFIFRHFSGLEDSRRLSIIPQGFFRCMPKLTYLDLSGCHIDVLPPDIGCLVELRYLNLSITKLTSLPDELGELGELKYLLLRSMPRGFIFPAILLTKLIKLRVLHTER